MRPTTLNIRIFSLGSRRLWMTATVLQSLISTTSIHAESTNKRMIIPGARAQALSGAFTAVSDDASAGWYNPAGLGFLKGPGVSASVNNYTTSKKTIENVTSGGDLAENSVSLYPGFAGANTTLGIFGVGWSYFTLEQQNTDESQKISIPPSNNLTLSSPTPRSSAFEYERSELTSGALIQTGASVAVSLSKTLSLGLSEFYYRRQKQTSLKERSTYPSGVFYDSFSRLSTKNEGTLTVAGLLVRGSDVSFGLSWRAPKPLSDKTDYETRSIIHSGPQPELNSQEITSHKEDELPVRTWNLGLAWTPKDYALVSADIVYYAPTTTSWTDSGGFDTKATTDWSVGIELRSKLFLIAGGAFTNNSLVEKPVPSLTKQTVGQINYTGFSAAFGFRNGRSENLFIMVRQRGKGYKQMVQGDLTLQSITVESQTFSLSSSYKL